MEMTRLDSRKTEGCTDKSELSTDKLSIRTVNSVIVPTYSIRNSVLATSLPKSTILRAFRLSHCDFRTRLFSFGRLRKFLDFQLSLAMNNELFQKPLRRLPLSNCWIEQ